MRLREKTAQALARKEVNLYDLARLLDCAESHVEDLIARRAFATGREAAILRLVAAAPRGTLGAILRDMHDGHEWRLIPGHENYEVSQAGEIRRAKGGHGSQPGCVIRQRAAREGYCRVNLSTNGAARTVQVHYAVCLAFHGPPPSPAHIVCHRNDRPSDNRRENLYWGTASANAMDRQRNQAAKLGTLLTHSAAKIADMPPRLTKKVVKAQMLERMARSAKKENPTPLVGEGCPTQPPSNGNTERQDPCRMTQRAAERRRNVPAGVARI